MNRKIMFALFLSLAILLVGVVILIAPVSSSVVTSETIVTGTEVITTSSSEAEFPAWILIATLLPMVVMGGMVISIMRQTQAKSKHKNHDFDEKPKHDPVYAVGDDGELVELIHPEVDELFDRR